MLPYQAKVYRTRYHINHSYKREIVRTHGGLA